MKIFGANLVRATLLTTGFILGVIVMITSSRASAASPSFNLTTSPLPVSLSTLPGKTVTAPIRVQNTGTQAVRIKVTLMKFSAFGSSGQPQILTPQPKDEFIKWASFSQTSFIAQPNVFNTVTMTIKVPQQAAFGYYYAVVFNQDSSNDPTPAATRQNKVNGAVATLLLLDVNAPGEKRQATVTRFTSAKKLYQYLPAKFTVQVKNTGNVHIVPTGNIFISRSQKTNLAVLSINKEQGNILPNSSRNFDVEWSDGFPVYQVKRINDQVISDKRGQPIQSLQYNFNHLSKLRIGKYYAHMTLVYNDGKRDVPIEGAVSFWVIPWLPILVLTLVLLLALAGLFVIVRPIIRRLKKLRPAKS
jgi:hypothetical protein